VGITGSIEDDKELITVGGRGLYFWHLKIDDLTKEIKEIAGRNMSWTEWTNTYNDLMYRKTFPDFGVDDSVIGGLLTSARAAGFAGKADEAPERYRLAVQLAKENDRPDQSNNVCWVASKHGYADIALAACEQAVGFEPTNAAYLDTRALARALD
jgi:hypothetical protein